MKIHFHGTSAAEGFPGLFCRCEHCIKASELGGKNIRTRTSVTIDDVLKIDFPPDTYYHVLRDRYNLAQVEDLFITHTHHDHLYTDDIGMRMPVFASEPDHPLHIYGHDLPMQLLTDKLERQDACFRFQRILPFVAVEAKTARVTPLLADHNPMETCLLFYIERNGKRILYAHDTGWFPDETWNFLKGRTVDLAIIDCTNGLLPYRRNHLNIEAVIEIQEIFQREAIFHSGSRMIATHFSHNIGLMHDDLMGILTPHGIITAYDGMIYHLSN